MSESDVTKDRIFRIFQDAQQNDINPVAAPPIETHIQTLSQVWAALSELVWGDTTRLARAQEKGEKDGGDQDRDQGDGGCDVEQRRGGFSSGLNYYGVPCPWPRSAGLISFSSHSL